METVHKEKLTATNVADEFQKMRKETANKKLKKMGKWWVGGMAAGLAGIASVIAFPASAVLAGVGWGMAAAGGSISAINSYRIGRHLYKNRQHK